MSAGLLFARANRFTVTTVVAVVVGLLLNALSGGTVSLPAVRTPVQVPDLVPGISTLLVGWTMIDRWDRSGVAWNRDPMWLASARIGSAVALALLVACLAVVGTGDASPVATTVWFLGLVALTAGTGWVYWWLTVLVLQDVVLRLRGGPFVELLREPLPGVVFLALSTVVALGVVHRRTTP